METPAVRQGRGFCSLALRVKPGAPVSRWLGLAAGRWRLQVKAPPREGEANRELVAVLSRRLGCPKASLTVVGGLKSRDKVVRVLGLTQAEIYQKLNEPEE